jgi:hypothetical protein
MANTGSGRLRHAFCSSFHARASRHSNPKAAGTSYWGHRHRAWGLGKAPPPHPWPWLHRGLRAFEPTGWLGGGCFEKNSIPASRGNARIPAALICICHRGHRTVLPHTPESDREFSSSDIPRPCRPRLLLLLLRTCLISDLLYSVHFLPSTLSACRPPSFVPVVQSPTPFPSSPLVAEACSPPAPLLPSDQQPGTTFVSPPTCRIRTARALNLLSNLLLIFGKPILCEQILVGVNLGVVVAGSQQSAQPRHGE